MGLTEQGVLTAAIATAVGGAVGAVAAAIAMLLKARHDASRATRADTIAEWKEIADRLQQRADNQELQLYAIHKELAACEKRAGEFSTEVKILQLQMRRVQGLTGDTAPQTVLPVTITADSNGTILNVSPSVAPLLQWLPKELYKQNIEVIVPESSRERHREAFARVVASGVAPDPDKTILTYALSKKGEEVPVSINVSGWQDVNGVWYLNAEVKKRAGGESVNLSPPRAKDIAEQVEKRASEQGYTEKKT